MKTIEQASNAGYKAAMAGEMRAPALNATIRAIIETNLNSHVETIQIYKSFIAGYEARIRDVMKELVSA
jgi:6-phosphofructokinase